nr:RNA-directed DNA polymerase, eukaryota, reverse transcriptase zinc-binding domain protein [Tanacetum cinerariifolium]
MIEVQDLCSSGLFFTWTKNLKKAREGNDIGVLKKLDRVMVNEEFMKKFDKAHVIFNPYLASDHSQAMVVIPNGMKKKKKAFKFANFIADKKSFIPIVEMEWKKQIDGFQMFQLVKKLRSSKIHLRKLNWQNGNLFDKVEEIRNELMNIQKNIDEDPYNKALRDAEVVILKDYVTTVEDEEKLLFQKSKIKWLSLGDKNNYFFHKTLKGRYQRTIIERIRDVNGNNFEGQDVADHDDEALSMKVIGDDFCKAIKEFFTSGKMLHELNSIVISLIPKTQSPLKVTDYRPIACCCRGLRQGDPISPYLFTLVMKRFTLMMERNVKRNPKFQYHYGCKSMKITHVCFADDLFVLCHGDADSAKVVIDSINEFGDCSGLRLGIKNCKCLVDKVRNKISNWKNKCLSYAELSRGKSMIVWKKICKPKSHGGMGLKDLKIWNKALLVKHIWSIADKKDTLWVKWISTVKLNGKNFCEVNAEVKESWGWKNLLEIIDEVVKNILHKLVNAEVKDSWGWKNLLEIIDEVVKNILHKLGNSKNTSNMKWPSERKNEYPSVEQINVPNLNAEKEDWLVWKNKDDKECKFIMREVYKDMRIQTSEIQWAKLIWYS